MHFLIVASLHQLLSVRHLLVAWFCQALAAMLTVGIMLAQLFHLFLEIEPQGHLFPKKKTSELNFHLNHSFPFIHFIYSELKHTKTKAEKSPRTDLPFEHLEYAALLVCEAW